MSDGEGRYHVVFNGEIYNHSELRRELEDAGFRFRTRCDTEVLLHAYREFGREMLGKLNGQFAFAVWDAIKQELFVARDRFGEKPLYWAIAPGGQILFASEIKSIIASGVITPRIDLTAVDAYLGLYYVPPDRSIYENVHVLRPAHAAIFRGESQETWRYWEPRYSHVNVDEVEAVKEVQRLLDRAVTRQMVADVPVGAFLSGGLDSTTIVALMSQHGSRPVQTFAAGFGDLIDELPFARAAAQHYRTDHHEMQMDIEVAAALHQMCAVYDEPFGDSSNIPTFLIAEYARHEVKVALSGDGGDEIFGGYSWYESLLQHSDPDSDAFDAHLATATVLNDDRQPLWGRRGLPGGRDSVAARFRSGSPLRTMDQATDFDITCYLAGDILVKVDRAAMAHGLETRAPFLDAEIADFVIGLPWKMRFGGGRLKHILRAACEPLWPESIRTRNKQGFGAPVKNWLEKPEVAPLWNRVTRSDSALSALLPGTPAVASQLRPQRRWSLLCLGLWLEGRESCLARLS
jgi:asparagine synthase (glutamine-hydrolysing)